MRQLRFTEEALRNAKAKATPEALPYLEKLSLDTTIGELGFFKGTGCDTCNGTGLKGRQGVYEVLVMSPSIRKLVMQNVGAAEIRDCGDRRRHADAANGRLAQGDEGNHHHRADDSRDVALTGATTAVHQDS